MDFQKLRYNIQNVQHKKEKEKRYVFHQLSSYMILAQLLSKKLTLTKQLHIILNAFKFEIIISLGWTLLHKN
jgi:hypothetical protein